jgi:hypothetical protein
MPLVDSIDADTLVERNFRMFRYELARPRDVLSLQNWVDGNACLARAETEYLEHASDLLCVSAAIEGGGTRLESWVEDCLIRGCKFLRRVRNAIP